jgi:hypothetical protein
MVPSVTHRTGSIKVSSTFKMSYSLHGTRVSLILFTFIQKLRLSCYYLYETDKWSIELFWGTYTEIRSNWRINEEVRQAMYAHL